MFLHFHPYPPYIPKNTTKLIVGTIPPPRFSTNELLQEDVNFSYGSKFGLLWPLMEKIFDLKLDYQNTKKAIDQRKSFLKNNNIGICDMINSCERNKINASDLGMNNIILRDTMRTISENPTIKTILFMGGNSKNGPEYLFRKQLRSHLVPYKLINNISPKIHEIDINDRVIQTVSLISPSNAANRSIGANLFYKKQKLKNELFSTFDFRLLQYQKYFL
jgi:G:T/U-mismatch repair DNA glycosylase